MHDVGEKMSQASLSKLVAKRQWEQAKPKLPYLKTNYTYKFKIKGDKIWNCSVRNPLVNPIQLSCRVLMLSLQCGWWGSVSVGGRLQTASDSQTLFVATTLGAILFVTPRRKWVVEFTQRGYPITLFFQLKTGNLSHCSTRTHIAFALALFSLQFVAQFSPPEQKWASKRYWRRPSFWNCKHSNNRKHVVSCYFITNTVYISTTMLTEKFYMKNTPQISSFLSIIFNINPV